MRNNWITIYDNTPDARFVYVSESITEHTGWEPEELIGREAYDLFHPDERKSIRKVHLANVFNEKMSSMVSYRFLRKDGSYMSIETIIHYCHDVMIGSNYVYDENSLDHKMRANSVDTVFVCLPNGSLQLAGAWNDREERMQHVLSMDKVWNEHRIKLHQERRFCLILNRFTEQLNIVYASNLATELVSLDIQYAIGKSFYEFVRERDFESLHAQIDMSKKYDMAVRLRFDWVIDREKNLTEAVEAIVSSTDDGLVLVLRLSPRLYMED